MTPDTRDKKGFLEECIFSLRLLLVVFSLSILIAGFTVSLSVSAYLLLIGQFLFALGFLAPVPPTVVPSRKAIGYLALFMVVATLVTNARRELITPNHGELVSPGNGSSLGAFELIPERDIVLLASRSLPFMGGISLTESENLLPTLYDMYAAMEEQRGNFSSPLFQSIIGMPYVANSEVLTFSPLTSGHPERAIIFLHGVGGNWSLLCWLISEAADSIGAQTFCPSLGILGTWGSERGMSVLGDLITKLQADGKQEIYLIGMSAGAVGAGQLAKTYEKKLHAVALICGSHPGIRDVSLPVLFLYGVRDERFPPKILRWIAKKSDVRNPEVTIMEVDGGHFLPIKQKDTFLKLLTSWLIKVSKQATANTNAIVTE